MDEKRNIFRIVIGLLGVLGSLFLLVAMTSFNPLDWPSPKSGVYPMPLHVTNLCGLAGAYLSYRLFYWFGAGAFTLALFGIGGFGWLMISRRIGEPYLRLAGVALLIAATASASALVNPGGPASLPEGNGGIVGIALTHFFSRYFSTFGTVLALIASAGVGLVLAADSLIVPVPLWLARVLRRSGPVFAGAAGRLVHVLPRALERQPASAAAPARPARSRPQPEADTAVIDDEPAPKAKPKREPPPVKRVPAVEVEPEADEPASEPALAPAPSTESADDAGQDEKKKAVLDRIKELVIKRARPADRPSQPVPPTPPEVLGDYKLPPMEMLKDPTGNYAEEQEEIVRGKAGELERTLQEFGVDAGVVQIDTGPVITMFELDLGTGVKVSQIVNLQNDIARALAAQSVRIVAPIPGKRTVGIEVPNADKEQVRIKELIEVSGAKSSKMALPTFLGKDASGDALLADLARNPHTLIAGATGSGKSVCINTIIMSLLLTQRPDHVKLILIDPKAVEMSSFKDLPHLMCPIITDMNKAAAVLEWAVSKMEERYELLSEVGARNISSFNKMTPEEIHQRLGCETEEDKARVMTHMPYMVIIIDELADLMMTAAKEVEHHIIRLAQKSRAIGIHLVVATQSPRVNVVTGLIKANMPCRLSFRVSSKQESRIVLDQNGAETLLGKGDMLYLRPGTAKLIRAQGTLVDDDEVSAIVNHLNTVAKPNFSQELIQLRPRREEGDVGDPGEASVPGERDEMFDPAVEVVLQNQRGSVSLLQRKLGIGYGRAARLIDQMAEAGIVGEYAGSNAREVLMALEDWYALKRQVAAEQNNGME